MKTSVQNVNYLPLFCSHIENYCQKFTPNVAAESPGVACYSTRQQNLQVNIGHVQKLLVGTYPNHVLLRPVSILQQTYPYQLVANNSMVNVTYANMMTVEQTADWIKALCVQRGWWEADAYALSFKKNRIKGCMLMHLNHEILNFDVGMPNHKHRLYILTVIRHFFPSFHHDVTSAPTRLSHLRGDAKQKNTTETSLMPGLPNPAQVKQSTLLHPAAPRGGTVFMDLRYIQNSSNKYESWDSKVSAINGSRMKGHNCVGLGAEFLTPILEDSQNF